MKIRTEKMNRTITQKNGEIYIKLDAVDIMSKEDFIEVYDGRVQEKTQLETRINQYKEFLTKIKNYEEEKDLKELSKKIDANQEFAQKVYALMQKKMVVEQLQVWEKALDGMEKELRDLGQTYKKLKSETKK